MTLQVFAGYDDRESLGYDVFCSSLRRRASEPVKIHPVGPAIGPIGSNAFTFSRFLVPWMAGCRGWAAFLDGSDMLMLEDIARLFDLGDPSKALQVVQHAPYQTRHPQKYVGTDMQCPNRDYERKNWASVMLINAGHPFWREVAPLDVFELKHVDILALRWVPNSLIGRLPPRWNVLVDEGQAAEAMAVAHWTAGYPGFRHYADAPAADLWHAERALKRPVMA